MNNKLNADKPAEINQKVTIASIRERILFTEFKQRRGDFDIKHISKVEGKESWDVIYLSGQTEYLAEIKIRDYALESWDEEGWILEKYKYDALEDLQFKANRPLKKTYINIFRDAVVIWDLDKITPVFFLRNSKTMTVEDKGRREKMVAYLKSNQGTVYYGANDIIKGQYIAQEIFKFLFPNYTPDIPKN